MPENVVFRYPHDASDQRKREIEAEALDDSRGDLDLELLPSLEHELPKEAWQTEVVRKVSGGYPFLCTPCLIV